MNTPAPHDSRFRSAFIAVAILVALPWLYVGSYAALVQSKASPTDPLMAPRVARYRVGGGFAETVYYPLEKLDRQFRQEFWTTPDCLRDWEW